LTDKKLDPKTLSERWKSLVDPTMDRLIECVIAGGVKTRYEAGMSRFLAVMDDKRSLLVAQDHQGASKGVIGSNLIGLSSINRSTAVGHRGRNFGEPWADNTTCVLINSPSSRRFGYRSRHALKSRQRGMGIVQVLGD
jgi:hypothetical protein